MVVDKRGEALSADTHFSIVKKVMGLDIDWGDQDSPEDPRDIVRIVRTYRRRPAWYNPLMFYPRTSVGFASHVLGIRNPLIKDSGRVVGLLRARWPWLTSMSSRTWRLRRRGPAMGRSKTLTPEQEAELEATILRYVSSGYSLKAACEQDDVTMSRRLVHDSLGEG